MTLAEAMLCILILGLTATGISALFVSGIQSLEGSGDQAIADSQLRSQLEQLIATPFADVLSTGAGTQNVTVGSQTYVLSWTATLHDLDGDSVPEPNALLVTASLHNRSLSVVLVDHEDRIGKIP